MRAKKCDRCRLCGEEFEGAFTENSVLALESVLCVCHGIISEEPLAPPICQVHFCKDGSYGIGDFFGAGKLNKNQQYL